MKPKANKSTKSTAFIVIETIRCNSCGFDENNAKVVLSSMLAKDDGWKAEGTVRCPNCGMALTSVEKRIPIEARDYKCPTCHDKTNLKYKITRVKKAGGSKADEFEFRADIVCGKLSHKLSLKKMIKSILEVLSIGVGPEGVKISKSG